MEKKTIETIGSTYSIESEINSGGFGTVYLVKDNKTNKKYAAKVLNKDDKYKIEVEINEKLKKLKIPNVVEYINSGIDTITLKDKEPKEMKYLILEYYPKGDLLKYIKHSGGLKEIYSKVLFKKVLETIQLIHKEGIYHFDLKLNNILLDDKYNPKIADFGLSKTVKESIDNKFTGNFGTKIYKPPQMHLEQKFDGAKSDIFSLGVTLFKLVTNNKPFNIAYQIGLYKFIKNHDYDNYWKQLNLKNIEVSDKFKKLFVQMVDFEEDKRPEIQQILSDKWFDEINKLDDEEKKKLEKDYISEFEKKEKIMDQQLHQTEDVKTREMKNESLNTKIFTNETNINCVEDEKIFNNYIKIKGNLNPIDFMNNFANEMENIYDDIIINNKNLKFNIIKKKEDNKNDEKNDNFDMTEDIEKDLDIQVELFKIKNDEFILNFIKKEGELNDYYKYLINVMKYAKDFI